VLYDSDTIRDDLIAMTDGFDMTEVVINYGNTFNYVFPVKNKKGKVLENTMVSVEIEFRPHLSN